MTEAINKQDQIGKLLSRFVAARISIGAARKSFTDKLGTQDFCASNGVDEKQARVILNLFVKSDTDRIQSILTAMRTHFVNNSFPTEQSGVRLISVGKFQEVLDRMDDFSLSLQHEIDRLRNNWEHVIENARLALGSKFDPKRYPEPEDLEELFYARIRLEPHPNMDVLCQETAAVISDAVRERMEQTKKDNEMIIQTVMSDIAQQIITTLDHVESRCTEIVEGKAKRIHTSMFSNVAKICETIAENLGDSELSGKVRHVQNKLREISNINPDYLRDEPQRAERVREEARSAVRMVKSELLSAL